MRRKVLRIATVPVYMNIVLKGQLEYLNNFFDVIAVTSYDKKHYEDILNREKVKMYKVNMSRTIAPIRDFISLILLIKIILKEKPNIIHTHTPKAGLIGLLAGFICRVPIRIHTVTGLPLMGTKGLKKRMLINIEKLTYSLANRVYPNSLALKKYILENKFTQQDKLKVLLNGSTNGVDTKFFNPNVLEGKQFLRKNYGIPENAMVLLFVGRIAKEKGIDELIDAFLNAQRKHLDVDLKLLLIGKYERHYGLLSKETESLIEKNDDIINLGRFDDVRPFYKMADIFVLPSYREGFPNSVMEAGSMGIASIVSDINGCNEIIENNFNGKIIPARNSKELLNAISELISNPIFLDFLSKNSRERILKKYERKDVLNSIKIEYEKLIVEHSC
jgi:glycosyltransferase involved in cell wall biosynthesis